MDQHSVSSILTDDEVTALAFALGKGQKEFLTEDVKIVVEWAEEISLKSALLEGVLSGKINLQIDNGEVLFSSGTNK
jgi:hypothetical protein